MDNAIRGGRLSVVMELAVLIGIFLAVKAWANSHELIGAGSMGVMAAVIVGTIILKLRGQSLKDLGLVWPQGWRGWIMTVVWTVVTMAAVLLILLFVVQPLLPKIFPDAPAPGGMERFDFFVGNPVYFVTFLVLVAWISAGFGEEMFMRGFIMNRTADLFGGTAAAWILALFGQAILFGVLHAYQGPAGIVMTGSIGFIFGAVYLLNGRKLWPLIFAHALIDTISLTQIYLAGGTASVHG